MSNRVSPAPASSPLPPVDSPIPDDLLPPPPPALLSDSDDDDDKGKNHYVPQHDGSSVTTLDIQQAVYTPPDVAEDNRDNKFTTASRTTTPETTTTTTTTAAAALSISTTADDHEHQTYKKTYYSEQDDNRNYNDNDNDDDDVDDTLFTSMQPGGDTGDGGDAAEEGKKGSATGDEGGGDQQQVRHRKPVAVGRLPPIGDNADIGATSVRDGNDEPPPSRVHHGQYEEGGEGGAPGATANWDHYPTPQQQHQHQQQGEEQDNSGFFNQSMQQQQQHQSHQSKYQQQEFAMSARPNSGIASRKDREDDTIIGANSTGNESGCCAIILTICSYILIVLFLPFSLCVTIKVVQEYERAVIFRLGRLLPGGAKGPGIFFVMPCIEEYTKVDLRTVSFDVPPQEVLTRDSVTVSVDAVVYYRISNPTVSVANVENAANSTQLLAQTTLRNVLGTQNLAEILSNREHISEQMQIVLDGATDKWGIKVERVEIKDVRLPTQLQRAMATEAEAARDARAKVIAAEGEQKASVALKEAADIIADSPAAMQLRYLQTLNSISAEKNSTIIFPIPIELVGSMMRNYSFRDSETLEVEDEDDDVINGEGRDKNANEHSVPSAPQTRLAGGRTSVDDHTVVQVSTINNESQGSRSSHFIPPEQQQTREKRRKSVTFSSPN